MPICSTEAEILRSVIEQFINVTAEKERALSLLAKHGVGENVGASYMGAFKSREAELLAAQRAAQDVIAWAQGKLRAEKMRDEMQQDVVIVVHDEIDEIDEIDEV